MCKTYPNLKTEYDPYSMLAIVHFKEKYITQKYMQQLLQGVQDASDHSIKYDSEVSSDHWTFFSVATPVMCYHDSKRS